MTGNIGLSAYASSPNGFGIDPGGQSNVNELQKALEAGYAVSSQTNGAALRVESLEGSLKVTQYNAHHIKFWKKIPKSPAYSTAEEYNELSSYGGNGGAFISEGQLPPTQDSTYTRKTSLIKFMGTTREVSHTMTVVHPAHGDVIALENQNGILWLLNNIEGALFHGDSSLAYNGESQSWDGLDALIDPTSYIDLEGASLQEADVEEGANQLVENFAYPTDLLLGTRVASDLVKTFYPRERFAMPAPQNGMVGMSVNSVMTQAGVMELNPNVFLKRLPSPSAAATSSYAPATPTSITPTKNADTDADFNKGAAAGTDYYSYVATACNRFGESAPTAVAGTGTSLTQTDKDEGNGFDLVIINAASVGSFVPEYFRIYRTAPQATNASVTAMSDYSLVMQVAATTQANSGTNTTYKDVNFLLPFTEIAYMGEMTPAVLTFRQLLPMMRLDLAVTAPAYRWMILLYGAPLLFTPKKWLRFINVGRLT